MKYSKKIWDAFINITVGKNQEGEVPRIFYCHIPKCAGNSMIEAIRLHMFTGYRKFDIDVEAGGKVSRLLAIDQMRVREIVLSYYLAIRQHHFGSGHVHCPPRIIDYHLSEWDFVTILRHPVDRWISEYVFNRYGNTSWANNTLSIDEYLESMIGRWTGSTFVRYFSSMPMDYDGNLDDFIDEAVANLTRFSVVGSVENIDGWCNLFKSRYEKGISIPRRNTSPNIDESKKIRADDSILRAVGIICEPDLRVYQRIEEISFLSKLKTQGS